MALSGSFSNDYVGDYFGLKVTWSGVQSVADNYTDITVNVYLKVRDIGVGARNDNPVKVDGVTKTYNTPAMNEPAGTHEKWLTTKTFRVNHNADGTKTVAISASWTANVTYSGVSVGVMTAGGSATLDPIPRTPTAPTTCTASPAAFYYGDTLTLAWSGATGHITGYKTQYRDKAPGAAAWGAWTAWKTPTAASCTDSITALCGAMRQYRVRAMNGSLASAWKESNAVTVSGGAKVRVNGAWRPGTAYVKVNGTWRRCAWIGVKSGGTWKKGV